MAPERLGDLFLFARAQLRSTVDDGVEVFWSHESCFGVGEST